MARRPEGWKLHRNTDDGAYIVRFTHAGRRRKLSTGKCDLGEASTAAAQIYASIVSGRCTTAEQSKASLTALALDEVAALWLASIETALDETTVDQYGLYVSGHWMSFFRTLNRLLDTTEDAYWRHRLRHVRRKTVLKELSALRGFLRWCRENGYATTVPILTSPPRKSTGVADKRRPHKVAFLALTAEQVEAVLVELPESFHYRRSKHPHPVRARFIVAWQTALRPATLDLLRAPDDYKKGSTHLVIRDEADKARYGRRLPLTERARAALDSVCPEVGLIFGRHNHRGLLRAAAKRAGLPSDIVANLSPYDLRHSRITYLAERSNNLAGIMYVAGHKHATTTNRYLRPSERAAQEVLDAATSELWPHTGHEPPAQESPPSEGKAKS